MTIVSISDLKLNENVTDKWTFELITVTLDYLHASAESHSKCS